MNPDSLRTNCREAARISHCVAGGLKLKSVLIFLQHADDPRRRTAATVHITRRRRMRTLGCRQSGRNPGDLRCHAGEGRIAT